jgi:predicted DNA-binding helix-hairpin-helix protein
MTVILSKPDTTEKLQILSNDAQYDLACACGSRKEEHRRRSKAGKWIYPVTLPNGGKSTLFKTLLSNVCTNDCKYCPLRDDMDVRRCTLAPEEIARQFMDYYNRGEVFGLFLSSAVFGSPDTTMDRLNSTAAILRRKYGYRGYIHLKVIPGASKAAIEQAVSLSSAVSLNIETPGADNLRKLSERKNYIRDIIEPIKLISRLTSKGSRYSRVKQTTQFIVGAADEKDDKIVKYMAGLYDRLNLQRVYFSSYQKGLGDSELPAEKQENNNPADTLNREHRLYQVDFLLRKYGFSQADIPFDENGNLPLNVDPKEAWAKANPQFFPVNVNLASREELLRVPGIGLVTTDRILKQRRESKIYRIGQVGKLTARLRKARSYLSF